jgi:thymidylate kinase
MKVAFTGTSGSGKTTLVKFLESELGLTHINGSAGILGGEALASLKTRYNYEGDGHLEVIRRSALNPDFAFDFQRVVLAERFKAFTLNDNFVTDRSPLDNLTYFALQASWNEQSLPRCESFENLCHYAMAELTHLIYIKPCQPDGKIEDNGSRIPNNLYQTAVDAVFEKFLERFKPNKLLVIDYWDLGTRKINLLEFIRPSQIQVAI